MYNEHAVMSRYGRTPAELEHVRNYLAMLKVAMSPDGELLAGDAFERLLHGLGIADSVAKEINAFSTKDVTVKQIVPAMRPDGQLARLLLRDAIDLMGQDGVYTMKERELIARLASELGVGLVTVGVIETLVGLERGGARLHSVLFFSK